MAKNETYRPILDAAYPLSCSTCPTVTACKETKLPPICRTCDKLRVCGCNTLDLTMCFFQVMAELSDESDRCNDAALGAVK